MSSIKSNLTISKNSFLSTFRNENNSTHNYRLFRKVGNILKKLNTKLEALGQNSEASWEMEIKTFAISKNTGFDPDTTTTLFDRKATCDIVS